jgi:hypothetical protein
MELRDNRTQQRCVVVMDRTRDVGDKFVTNFAIFIAHRQRIEKHRASRLGNVDIFGHAAPHRFDRIADVV